MGQLQQWTAADAPKAFREPIPGIEKHGPEIFPAAQGYLDEALRQTTEALGSRIFRPLAISDVAYTCLAGILNDCEHVRDRSADTQAAGAVFWRLRNDPRASAAIEKAYGRPFPPIELYLEGGELHQREVTTVVVAA